MPDRQNREPFGWEQIELTEDQLQAIAAPTWPWSQWNRYPNEFTPEPETGVMPNGMLAIDGNELSNHGHISYLYNDYAMLRRNRSKAPAEIPKQDCGTEHESLVQIGAKHGIAYLNHPDNDLVKIDHYTNLFAHHPHLLGIEVCQP